MNEPKKHYLEIECKYNAEEMNRMAFKDLATSLNPTRFVYVESHDIYYERAENDFLRYRMPAVNSQNGVKDARAELAFKKKHAEKNNVIRTEVNLRVDSNDPHLVDAFCEGLGYKRNFSIYKSCDIYFYPDADIVFYSVKDEAGKYAYYMEIEVDESLNITENEGWDIISKYEKLLAPLGITAQKRKRLSLYEMYRKEIKV